MTPDQATTVNDYERLVEWFRDPQRKDPSLAFTAGPARTAAMAFVDSGVAVEIQRLRAALAELSAEFRLGGDEYAAVRLETVLEET